MKVWVLFYMDYSSFDVVSVHASLESAKNTRDGEWEDDRGEWVHEDGYYISEFELVS